MGTLSKVLFYEMFFVLLALGVIVAYRMFTGQINTRGLMRDKAGGPATSPGRVQMLLVTLVIAVYYVAQVKITKTLPKMPPAFLAALGGSHAIYLGGKFYSLLIGKLELAASRIVHKSTKTVNGG